MAKSNLYGFVILTLLLAGCSTGNKFASSFGKRKYTKGYYWESPGSIETVHRKSEGNVKIAEARKRNDEIAEKNRVSITDNLPPKPENTNKSHHKNSVTICVPNTKDVAPLWQKSTMEAATIAPQDSIKENKKGNDKAMLHTAQAVFLSGILAIVISLTSVFLSSTAISFGLFFILGLVLVVIGVVLFALVPRKPMPEAGNTERTPPKSTRDPANEYTNLGLLGFIMALGSIVLIAVTLVIVSTLLSSSQSLLVALASFVFIEAGTFISLVAMIVALILCEIGMHHKDAHPGLAKAGATISGVILGVLLTIFLLSLV